MRSSFRTLMLIALVAVAPIARASAQDHSAHHAAQPVGLTKDLLADIAQVEQKMIGLARAIPEDRFSWRPGAGVRSVSEVLMHIASDNHWFPAALGYPAEASTGVKGDDFNTAVTFEKRTVTKAQAIAELEKSFAFFRQSLGATTPDQMGKEVRLFGRPFTTQAAWLMATTHLHEHLGQLIAYARSNDVKPPWGA